MVWQAASSTKLTEDPFIIASVLSVCQGKPCAGNRPRAVKGARARFGIRALGGQSGLCPDRHDRRGQSFAPACAPNTLLLRPPLTCAGSWLCHVTCIQIGAMGPFAFIRASVVVHTASPGFW